MPQSDEAAKRRSEKSIARDDRGRPGRESCFGVLWKRWRLSESPVWGWANLLPQRCLHCLHCWSLAGVYLWSLWSLCHSLDCPGVSRVSLLGNAKPRLPHKSDGFRPSSSQAPTSISHCLPKEPLDKGKSGNDGEVGLEPPCASPGPGRHDWLWRVPWLSALSDKPANRCRLAWLSTS